MVSLICLMKFQCMDIRLWTRLPNGSTFASKLIGRLNRRTRRNFAGRLDVHFRSRPRGTNVIHRGDWVMFTDNLFLRTSDRNIWFWLLSAWFLEPFVENILRILSNGGLLQHLTAERQILIFFVHVIWRSLVDQSGRFLVDCFSWTRTMHFLMHYLMKFGRLLLKFLTIHFFRLRIEIVPRVHL